jgi:hypothetical protein
MQAGASMDAGRTGKFAARDDELVALPECGPHPPFCDSTIVWSIS